MIFKLEFADRTEYVQAKEVFHLIDEYVKEYGNDEFLEVHKIGKISDEEAKTIMIKNVDSSTFDECPEFSLYTLVVGDDFVIVASTQWD